MITASTARQLQDQNHQQVQYFLMSKVEPLVRDAAMQGKSSVFVRLGSVAADEPLYRIITALHRSLLAQLEFLGYRADIVVNGGFYIDPTGSRVRNYGISIKW